MFTAPQAFLFTTEKAITGVGVGCGPKYHFGDVGVSYFAPKLAALGAASRLAIFFAGRTLGFEQNAPGRRCPDARDRNC